MTPRTASRAPIGIEESTIPRTSHSRPRNDAARERKGGATPPRQVQKRLQELQEKESQVRRGAPVLSELHETWLVVRPRRPRRRRRRPLCSFGTRWSPKRALLLVLALAPGVAVQPWRCGPGESHAPGPGAASPLRDIDRPHAVFRPRHPPLLPGERPAAGLLPPLRAEFHPGPGRLPPGPLPARVPPVLLRRGHGPPHSRHLPGRPSPPPHLGRELGAYVLLQQPDHVHRLRRPQGRRPLLRRRPGPAELARPLPGPAHRPGGQRRRHPRLPHRLPVPLRPPRQRRLGRAAPGPRGPARLPGPPRPGPRRRPGPTAPPAGRLRAPARRLRLLRRPRGRPRGGQDAQPLHLAVQDPRRLPRPAAAVQQPRPLHPGLLLRPPPPPGVPLVAQGLGNAPDRSHLRRRGRRSSCLDTLADPGDWLGAPAGGVLKAFFSTARG